MGSSTEKDLKAIAGAKTLTNIPWCEDYERMISGMLYNPIAPELIQGRFRARKICHKINNDFPDDATVETLTVHRETLQRELLGKVGENVFIEPPMFIDYGSNISVGDGFYANFNTTILDCGLVKIGNRVFFGPSVSIFAATHETEVQSRRENIEYARGVDIGDDCWIGGNTTILPGITVGEGCTIGTGSVVTRDIPPFSVAVGSPARVIKKVGAVPPMDGAVHTLPK